MSIKKSIPFTLSVAALFSSAVYAQGGQPPRIDGILNMFDSVASLIMPVAGLVAVIMIIYAGYMWIIAGGDAQKIELARGTLTWAIIGLIFLGLFRALINLVFDFFV